VNPDQSSSVTATLVGVAIALSTAAAQELGAPRIVWVGAAIAGGLTFVVALVLYLSQNRGLLPGELPSQSPPLRRAPSRWILALQRDFAAGIAVVGLVGIGVYAAMSIDLTPSGEPTVIVCVDSGSSTAKVRRSYLSDLKTVVWQAATGQANLYAADCGYNATGTVNWPVQKKFSVQFGGRWGRQEALRQAERVFARGIGGLVRARSGSRAAPLGEVLSVMARQCEQAGGGCKLFVFTTGEWSDGLLRARDGIGRGERREYLKAYRSQLEGLADSQINFVGVGFGTSMGSVRLDEAHDLAQQLVEDAGGKMGSWTTRL